MFKKIIPDTNWCHIDKLDGIELKDGERLRIRFPSKETLEVNITVWHEIKTINEMGRPYDMPVKRAYLKTKWKGAPCMVELVGLEAERVKGT